MILASTVFEIIIGGLKGENRQFCLPWTWTRRQGQSISSL